MKITRVIFIFLLFLNISLYSQVKKIDSLRLSFKTAKHDSTRYNCLMKIGRILEGLKPDSAIYFYTQAQSLAEQLNDELKQGEALKSIGWSNFLLGNFENAMIQYNKALTITNKLLLVKDELIKKKAQKLHSSVLAKIGVISASKGNYPVAEEFYLKALKIAEEIGDKRLLTINYVYIGNCCFVRAHFTKALEYYFKALKIAEDQGDKNSQISLMNNMGGVYFSQMDYPKALDYYFKGLKIEEELADRRSQISNLGNIGLVYMRQLQYPKALVYYFNALKIADELGDNHLRAINIGNIGIVYQKQFNYTKALENYLEALKIAQTMGNKALQSSNLLNIGGIYAKLNKFKEAEKFTKESLKIANELKALQQIKESYQSLFYIYEKTHRPALALDYYKSSIKYRDSIFNGENIKKSIQMQMNFDFEKKRTADNLIIEEERKTNLVKFEKEKTQRYALYGGLGLVIIFAGLMFNRFKITQKQKLIIEIKEQETQKQNEIITQQKDLVEEKQKEILDSIHYAKRIQTAMITNEKYIEKALNKLQNKN